MNEDTWRLDVLETTISILDERIDQAIAFLLHPDTGYGLSAVGVVQLINLLRGEDDGPLRTPGQLA